MLKCTLFLLTFLQLFIITGYGQSPLSPAGINVMEKLSRKFYRVDTTKGAFVYDPDVKDWIQSNNGLSAATLDSVFKPLYNRVLFGGNDLVNQGSAYALAVNQFESQFSMSYSWMANKNKIHGKYYNLGFSASSSSKLLPVFSKDEWQQGFTLTLGFTKAFRNNLSYDKKEDFPKERRRAMMLSLKEIYQQLHADPVTFQAKKDQVDSIYFNSNLEEKIAQLTLTGNKSLADEQAKIDQLNYLHSLDSSDKKLSSFADSCVTAFELKYFKEFYYSFWWFNVLGRPEYKGISIYDTTAAKMAGIQKKNYFRIGFDAYANYVRNGDNLFLLQFGFNVKNSNYLEGRKPADIEFLQTPVGDTTLLINAKGVVVDDYEKYKKGFMLLSPSAGFNWFFGAKRRIGWEAFASTKLALKKKEIPFDNLFTIRTGLLVSLNGKSDLAKSTFGLLAQWEDLKYKSDGISDGFTFSLRIGIPFNF